MLIRIAIRNVFRHRVRSLVSLSAIAFGCVCVVFLAGYIADVYKNMRDSYVRGRTGHLQVYKEGYFVNGQRRPFDYMIENPTEVRAALEKIPHVQRVTERLEIPGLVSFGNNSAPCIIQGVDPAATKPEAPTANRWAYQIMSQSGLVLLRGQGFDGQNAYQMLLGLGLADGLGVGINDGLTLMVNTVHGGLNALDFIAQGVFQTSYKSFDDRTLKIPLHMAQELVDTASVHSLVVFVDDANVTADTKAAIAKIAAAQGWTLEIKTWRELSDFYVQTEELFNRMFLVVQIVIAMIVVLSIYNTLSMVVMERIDEIGTLRALGLKRARILQLFLSEALVLGVIGGVIGIVLGSLFTFTVGRIGIPMPPAPGSSMSYYLKPAVVPVGIVCAFILSMSTVFIASLIPSYRASRLDIAEALRHCN